MVTIEKMSPDDADRVKALEIESKLSPWPADDYRSEAARPDSIALVVRNKEQIIGFLISRLIMAENNPSQDISYVSCEADPINRGSADDKDALNKDALNNDSQRETELEIYNIAVAAAHRRDRIGSKLLEALLEMAARENVRRISLEVRKSNEAAVFFYRKHRFESLGLRRNFYRDPVEDALLMGRELFR